MDKEAIPATTRKTVPATSKATLHRLKIGAIALKCIEKRELLKQLQDAQEAKQKAEDALLTVETEGKEDQKYLELMVTLHSYINETKIRIECFEKVLKILTKEGSSTEKAVNILDVIGLDCTLKD